MSLSACALWLLPRLVSREVLAPEVCSVLKMAALRGEPQLLAPFEVYVGCLGLALCSHYRAWHVLEALVKMIVVVGVVLVGVVIVAAAAAAAVVVVVVVVVVVDDWMVDGSVGRVPFAFATSHGSSTERRYVAVQVHPQCARRRGRGRGCPSARPEGVPHGTVPGVPNPHRGRVAAGAARRPVLHGAPRGGRRG